MNEHREIKRESGRDGGKYMDCKGILKMRNNEEN